MEQTNEIPQLPKDYAKQAMQYLITAKPVFRHKAYKASAAVLRRVLTALIEAPTDKEFKATMGEEQQLYDIGTMITSAKFVIFSEERLNRALADKTSSTAVAVENVEAGASTQTNGETENGSLD